LNWQPFAFVIGCSADAESEYEIPRAFSRVNPTIEAKRRLLSFLVPLRGNNPPPYVLRADLPRGNLSCEACADSSEIDARRPRSPEKERERERAREKEREKRVSSSRLRALQRTRSRIVVKVTGCSVLVREGSSLLN